MRLSEYYEEIMTEDLEKTAESDEQYAAGRLMGHGFLFEIEKVAIGDTAAGRAGINRAFRQGAIRDQMGASAKNMFSKGGRGGWRGVVDHVGQGAKQGAQKTLRRAPRVAKRVMEQGVGSVVGAGKANTVLKGAAKVARGAGGNKLLSGPGLGKSLGRIALKYGKKFKK